MLLDAYIPEPRLAAVDSLDVEVAAAHAYEVIRRFNASRVPFVRMLGGYHILCERPGFGIAVGSIGRPWLPTDAPRDVLPEAFADFAEVGLGKAAWALTVEAVDVQHARVLFELRATATDEIAWQAMSAFIRTLGKPSEQLFAHLRPLLTGAPSRPSHESLEDAPTTERSPLRKNLGRVAHDSPADVAEGLVGAAGIVLDLLTPFLRGVRSHWGLDRALAARDYPGDHLVPDPRWSWTHGVEIAATCDDVWPWVAQIGQDKAGFYSYQFLENLAGCNVQNASELHAAWVDPGVGDSIVLHPEAPPIPIVAVEPGHLLLAHGRLDPSTGTFPTEGAADEVVMTWLFCLESTGPGSSRLISRYRSSCRGGLMTRLLYGPYLTESVGFVMDRRMLLGIKQRAERPRQPGR